jgi:hypothetical protein
MHWAPDVTVAPATAHVRRSLEAACRARGVALEGARLIHHYNNAVYLLPSAGAVARVTIGSSGHDAAIRAHATVSRLVQQGFPATSPLPGVDPVEVDESSVVSFWSYYPQGARPGPGSRELGPILRRLHDLDSFDDLPVDLPVWTPLASLQRALGTVDHHGVLSDEEWSWLHSEVSRVRTAIADLDWPMGRGVIHGDAWAGNLLWVTQDGTAKGGHVAVLGDWDSLAIGPREVDLIPTWHAARRYAKGDSWITAFRQGYDYDLADWSGFETLFRMRDLMQITGPLRRAQHGDVFRSALRQRVLGAMRRDDTPWVAL